MPIAKRKLKNFIKSALWKSGLSHHHFGVSLYDDIRLRLPRELISTIFDVGANRGQSARDFLERYPTAHIHCFEPNPDCCAMLRNLPLIVHETAIGSTVGTAGFDKSRGSDDMFRLSAAAPETVSVTTIDAVLETHNIASISLLKIDTEGHDLEVIRGARSAISEQRIDLLQAEVSMNRDNTYHIPFVSVQDEMEGYGYRLFAIYEQMHEWPTSMPNLRRSNVVYISPRVASRNKLRQA